ncbi:MAG: putative transposase [Granulosicoccus sp.]|jgi:transposase-like protein
MARISFSGRRFKQELILQSVRWYLADVLSYRDIEEMIQERCINVDHRTIHRWMIHYAPQLEKKFRTKKRKPFRRWRLEET